MNIFSIFKKTDDPVKLCEFYNYNENGWCDHVDGYLCRMSDCDILKDYKDSKNEKQ